MFFYFDIINGLLEPEFSEDNLYYDVYIDSNIEKLRFDFKMDPKSTINIIGNNDLKDGESFIYIDILKDNILRTYIFKIHKEKTKEVMSYDDATILEINTPVKNYTYAHGIIILTSLILFIFLFRIFFISKKKHKTMPHFY